MSDLLTRFLGAADFTTIAVSALDDQVAAFALRQDIRTRILQRNLAICKENLRAWDAFVEEHKGRVEWVRPQGAGTGWLRVKAKQEKGGWGNGGGGGGGGGWVDDFEFATAMVREVGCLVVPGAHCFSDGIGDDGNVGGGVVDVKGAVEKAFRGYVRVALGNKPEDTRRALEVFGRYLEEGGR